MRLTPPALILLVASGLIASAPGAETNRPNFDLVRQLNEAFVQVAESVSPSVVVLTVTEKATVFAEPAEKESAEHEYWRRYHREFNDEPSEGQGSGIIIRKNGYILTNRHVVEDAESIRVRLLDGRSFKATVHGVDAPSDVAILKIEAEDLPVARLGDSSRVRVGEFAIAIGAPFSLDYSVTFGHISAKSRANVVPFFLGGQTMDQDFLQTDANINPGNSGGPLVNIEGEVIGVNTLIRGLRSGIGFAIPINLAKQVAEEIIQHGKFRRPWLGIEIGSLADFPELAATNSATSGVVVRSLVQNGPATGSDLRSEDVIIAVDGVRVGTPQQLRNEVRLRKIGDTVKLEVLRSGKPIAVQMHTAEYAPFSIPTNAPSERPSVR
jgi:serine protease Do